MLRTYSPDWDWDSIYFEEFPKLREEEEEISELVGVFYDTPVPGNQGNL